jgi:hypothetical protein
VLGDETLQRIAGTSLDTPSEIAALAAMEEQERVQIIERAVAGETVSALKPERMSEESKTMPSFGMSAYKLASGLAAVPTPALQNKLNQAVQCRADLPARERRRLRAKPDKKICRLSGCDAEFVKDALHGVSLCTVGWRDFLRGRK